MPKINLYRLLVILLGIFVVVTGGIFIFLNKKSARLITSSPPFFAERPLSFKDYQTFSNFCYVNFNGKIKTGENDVKYIKTGSLLEYPDVDSFVVIGNNNRISYDSNNPENYYPCFGRDKSNVFLNTGAIVEADPTTFRPIKGSFSKDSSHVFYGFDIINGVDMKTFTVLSYNLSKDKNHVYYKKNNFIDADPNSFIILKDSYTKDSSHVFYNDKVIGGVDIATFVLLQGGYAKDKINVYYTGKVLADADPQTFEILQGGYAKDSKTVFCNGSPCLENFDAYSFVVNNNYIKDKNRVKVCISDGYDSCNFAKFSIADPATFVIISDLFAKDKNHVYYWDKIVEGVDIGTFEVIKQNYAKDKNSVYYGRRKIPGADIPTFVVEDTTSGWYANANDKNHSYFEGEMLDSVAN